MRIFTRIPCALLALAALLAGTLLFAGCATRGGSNSASADSSGAVKGATLLMKPYNAHHHPD